MFHVFRFSVPSINNKKEKSCHIETRSSEISRLFDRILPQGVNEKGPVVIEQFQSLVPL